MKMKKKAILFASSFITIMVLMIFLFFFFTIKNSKGCDQFVIDTYEIATGINIPKQIDTECYYDKKTNTRIGIYRINKIDEFITKNGFLKLDNNKNLQLWTIDFLLEDKKIETPGSFDDLYGLTGSHKGDLWQCIIDRNTGKMWIEIKWKK
jgi:hypothetical protein